MRGIKLTDLRLQYQEIGEEIEKVIRRVLEEGEFILGRELERFEEELAEFCGVEYAVGVASGTDALVIALLALGIGKGDAVITSPFTFIATAEAIIRVGAKPVFADICFQDLTLDPKEIEQCLSTGKENFRAILPVHLYGQMANMERIREIADRYRLKVIEDAAQAIGGEIKTRTGVIKVGTISDVGCLSFFPSKNLGGCGDGGAIITNSKEIAEKAKVLRNHGGRNGRYLFHGLNSRLDNLQAGVLRVKLKYLNSWLKMRQRNARYYNELLKGIPNLLLPSVERGGVFNYYTIRIKGNRRERVEKMLKKEGVESAVYYPVCLHLQEVYRELGYKQGDFPVAEQAQKEVLSLPMYPELRKEEIEKIADLVKRALKES